MLSIGAQTISLLVNRQAQLEIEVVQRDRSIRFHLIDLHTDDDPGLWNFTRATLLIADSRRRSRSLLVFDRAGLGK